MPAFPLYRGYCLDYHCVPAIIPLSYPSLPCFATALSHALTPFKALSVSFCLSPDLTCRVYNAPGPRPGCSLAAGKEKVKGLKHQES